MSSWLWSTAPLPMRTGRGPRVPAERGEGPRGREHEQLEGESASQHRLPPGAVVPACLHPAAPDRACLVESRFRLVAAGEDERFLRGAREDEESPVARAELKAPTHRSIRE